MSTIRISATEFDAFSATEERRFELLDGEVIEIPTPPIIHQRLAGRVMLLVDSLIPNGEVFISPLEVYLDEYNIPQPDLMWVTSNSVTCQITEKRLVGAPDLLVEIFTNGTIKIDKIDKFFLYEKHGCREYWIVDPEYAQIEIWKRGANGFERQGLYKVGDTFESAVLGGKTVEIAPIFS